MKKRSAKNEFEKGLEEGRSASSAPSLANDAAPSAERTAPHPT
jgi:hypothetical protein